MQKLVGGVLASLCNTIVGTLKMWPSSSRYYIQICIRMGGGSCLVILFLLHSDNKEPKPLTIICDTYVLFFPFLFFFKLSRVAWVLLFQKWNPP